MAKNPSIFPMRDEHYEITGLTMRDYFAGLAMQSVFLDVGADIRSDMVTTLFEENLLGKVAEKSYQMADEMLKARGRTP